MREKIRGKSSNPWRAAFKGYRADSDKSARLRMSALINIRRIDLFRRSPTSFLWWEEGYPILARRPAPHSPFKRSPERKVWARGDRDLAIWSWQFNSLIDRENYPSCTLVHGTPTQSRRITEKLNNYINYLYSCPYVNVSRAHFF